MNNLMPQPEGVPMPDGFKVRTYSGFAVKVPLALSDEIMRIKPRKDAPSNLAIFDTHEEAKQFTDMINLHESLIFPVTIVRSDGMSMLQ